MKVLGESLADGWFVDLTPCGRLGGWAIVDGVGRPAQRLGDTLVLHDDFAGSAFGFGTNDAGDVVGWTFGVEATEAFVIPAGGKRVDLSTLGGDGAVPQAIDAGGRWVVGESQATAGLFEPTFPALWILERSEDGTDVEVEAVELPGLSGQGGVAYAISRHGVIAGSATDSEGMSHAVIWEPQADGGYLLHELGVGFATDVADSGLVVGAIEDADGVQRAFVALDRALRFLPVPEGCEQCDTAAGAINNYGQAVGWVFPAAGSVRSLYWDLAAENPVAHALGDIVDSEFGDSIVLEAGQDINNAGQVLAAGDFDAEPRTFLLTPQGARDPDVDDDGIPDSCQPVTFTRGDANDDGRVSLVDGLFVLRGIFQDGPWPSCEDAADANDDGSISLGDAILVFQFLFADTPMATAAECGVDPTPDDLLCEQSPNCGS